MTEAELLLVARLWDWASERAEDPTRYDPALVAILDGMMDVFSLPGASPVRAARAWEDVPEEEQRMRLRVLKPPGS